MPAGQSLEAIEYFPYPEQAGVYYNYRRYQYSTEVVPYPKLYRYWNYTSTSILKTSPLSKIIILLSFFIVYRI